MAISRSRGARPVTSRPPMRISPAVASSRPPTIRSTVVFPDPDGPTSTRNSPSATSRSSDETATAPPGNALVTPERTIPDIRCSVTTGYPSAADAAEAPPLSADPGTRRALARHLLRVGGGAADRARRHDASDEGDDDHHRRTTVQVQAVGRGQGAGGPPGGAGGAPSGAGCGRARNGFGPVGSPSSSDPVGSGL